MSHRCPDPVCGATFTSEACLAIHLEKWHLPGVWGVHPSLEDQEMFYVGILKASDLPKPVSSLVEPHPELPLVTPGLAPGVGAGAHLPSNGTPLFIGNYALLVFLVDKTSVFRTQSRQICAEKIKTLGFGI